MDASLPQMSWGAMLPFLVITGTGLLVLVLVRQARAPAISTKGTSQGWKRYTDPHAIDLVSPVDRFRDRRAWDSDRLALALHDVPLVDGITEAR